MDVQKLTCLITGHVEFPHSRWVLPRWSDEPGVDPDDKMLWMFYKCARCKRIRFSHDTGKRWSMLPEELYTPSNIRPNVVHPGYD